MSQIHYLRNHKYVWCDFKGRNGDHGVDGAKGDKGDIGLQGQKGDQVGLLYVLRFSIIT